MQVTLSVRKDGLPAGAPPSASVHLVVLQHGLWGTPADLSYVATVLRRSPAARQGNLVILNSGVNASRLTYDGLDVLGDRLAALITSFITRLHTTPIEPSYHVPTTGPFLPPNRRVAKISFIGYSLGGLICRYAIGKLAATGFFASVTPVNYVSFASPHLGAWSPPTTLYRQALNLVLPWTLSVTGSQLVMADTYMDGLPLLAVMADPRYAFHAGLTLFQKRIALANVSNDYTVPYYTAIIEPDTDSDTSLQGDTLQKELHTEPAQNKSLSCDASNVASNVCNPQQLLGQDAKQQERGLTLEPGSLQTPEAAQPCTAFSLHANALYTQQTTGSLSASDDSPRSTSDLVHAQHQAGCADMGAELPSQQQEQTRHHPPQQHHQQVSPVAAAASGGRLRKQLPVPMSPSSSPPKPPSSSSAPNLTRASVSGPLLPPGTSDSRPTLATPFRAWLQRAGAEAAAETRAATAHVAATVLARATSQPAPMKRCSSSGPRMPRTSSAGSSIQAAPGRSASGLLSLLGLGSTTNAVSSVSKQQPRAAQAGRKSGSRFALPWVMQAPIPRLTSRRRPPPVQLQPSHSPAAGPCNDSDSSSSSSGSSSSGRNASPKHASGGAHSWVVVQGTDSSNARRLPATLDTPGAIGQSPGQHTPNEAEPCCQDVAPGSSTSGSSERGTAEPGSAAPHVAGSRGRLTRGSSGPLAGAGPHRPGHDAAALARRHTSQGLGRQWLHPGWWLMQAPRQAPAMASTRAGGSTTGSLAGSEAQVRPQPPQPGLLHRLHHLAMSTQHTLQARGPPRLVGKLQHATGGGAARQGSLQLSNSSGRSSAPAWSLLRGSRLCGWPASTSTPFYQSLQHWFTAGSLLARLLAGSGSNQGSSAASSGQQVSHGSRPFLQQPSLLNRLLLWAGLCPDALYYQRHTISYDTARHHAAGQQASPAGCRGAHMVLGPAGSSSTAAWVSPHSRGQPQRHHHHHHHYRLHSELFLALLPILLLLWGCMLLWLAVCSAHHYLLLAAVRRDRTWPVRWQPSAVVEDITETQHASGALIISAPQQQLGSSPVTSMQVSLVVATGDVQSSPETAGVSESLTDASCTATLTAVQPAEEQAAVVAPTSTPGTLAAAVTGSLDDPGSHLRPSGTEAHESRLCTEEPSLTDWTSLALNGNVEACEASAANQPPGHEGAPDAMDQGGGVQKKTTGPEAKGPEHYQDLVNQQSPRSSELAEDLYKSDAEQDNDEAGTGPPCMLLLQAAADAAAAAASSDACAQVPSAASAIPPSTPAPHIKAATSQVGAHASPDRAAGASHHAAAGHAASCSGAGGTRSQHESGAAGGALSHVLDQASEADQSTSGTSRGPSTGYGRKQRPPPAQLQAMMIKHLNQLPWLKVDVETGHYHAHAAIVVRSTPRFAASHGHIVEFAVKQMRL